MLISGTHEDGVCFLNIFHGFSRHTSMEYMTLYILYTPEAKTQTWEDPVMFEGLP